MGSNGNGSNGVEQIVYVDTETTGLLAHHDVFEIAMIKGDEEVVIWLPVDLSKADPDALRINRFYERQKEGYEKYRMKGEDGAWKIAEFTSGCTLAGIVPSFDATMVSGTLLKHGLRPAWNYWIRDVVTFAAGSLGLRGKTNSRIVSEALGAAMPDEREVHTAIGDARWAKRIDTKALELTSEDHRKLDLERKILVLLRDEGFDETEKKLRETARRWASKLIAPSAPAKASA
jgi:hypothetical protein